MRSLLPMEGLFGDTVLDQFFKDVPTIYRDYVAAPKCNIAELKDHYEVTAEMPGFSKDQIHISMENGVLSISAEKEETKETKDEERRYIRRERGVSAFQRQFSVKGIKESDIKASLKDGILKIELPKLKKEIEKPSRQIEIE
ncbi:MAG: Hsp20/alpha crystallin family protein [Dialister sp.]|nr:Hsp20/alpha crystallin family protein [Dialister sp.]